MNWNILNKASLTFLTVLFLSLSLVLSCGAQELKRKAQLGIYMSPLADSTAEALNLTKGKGLFINDVVANTTVTKVGMKQGAVLLKINQVEMNSNADLFAQISDLRAGDDIQFDFFQDGKLYSKSTKASERPREKYNNANVSYGHVSFKGNVSRTILYTPKEVDNPPVVFYLQGYTCGSIDFANQEFNPIYKLIKQWVDAGYAVFRVEKPGVGDSESDKPCSEINFDEEVEAFRQAYMHLQKDKRIDSDNIFLFGHSMGGIISPVLAKEFKPKGVITFGITVNSWFEYMQELTRVQGEMFNTPYEEIEQNFRRSVPFWYELFVEQKSNEEILKNDVIKKNLEEDGVLEQFKAGQFMGRHYTFWSTLNQLSLYSTLPEVESNVLALYGEYDIQALNADHIETIANIVNSTHPGKGEYKVIPNTDHGFVRFNSMQENVQTINSPGYIQYVRDNFNPATGKYTIEWMNRLR